MSGRRLPRIDARNRASAARRQARRRQLAIANALTDRELLFTIPAIRRLNRDLTRLRAARMLGRVPSSRVLTDAISRSFWTIRSPPVPTRRVQRLRALWSTILEREFRLPPGSYE